MHIVYPLPIRLLFIAAVLCSCGKTSPYTMTDNHPQLTSSLPMRTVTPTPLIIEWSSADRGALERRLQQGTVVIRVENNELSVLDDCVVPGAYQYRGFTRKLETHVITTENELNATFAMGAARLGTTLRQHGKLYVSLSLVGQYENDLQNDGALFQHPECRGATHIIQSATVGAFRFYSGAEETAGADAKLGHISGPGAGRVTNTHFLKSDGDFDDCETASATDDTSPEGCAALVRLQLRQIGRPFEQPEIPVYHLGEQPFLFSDVVQLDEKPASDSVRWQRGPYPETLCNQLGAVGAQKVFAPMMAYCRMRRDDCAVVIENGVPVEKKEGWHLYNLPPHNPYADSLATYDRIRHAIERLPLSKQNGLQWLLYQILAEYHWHVTRTAPDSTALHELSDILEPLRTRVSLPLRTEGEWWAAHLLFVAGMEDYANSLARAVPVRFATPWHLLFAGNLSIHEARAIFPDALETLPHCNMLRADVLYKYAEVLLTNGDLEGSLKYEIEAERETEANGIWLFPGASIFQQAQFLGVKDETAHYLGDYPWVLGDYLWSQATNCFIHEEYLCVRKNLYDILARAPQSPVVPMAYQALIELESAMGNRKAAFQLKMDEPHWTVNSPWGKSLLSVPKCAVHPDQIAKTVRLVTSGQPHRINLSRGNYELMGRNVGQWQALLAVGSALRECRFLSDDTTEGWMTLERNAQSDFRVKLNTSANLRPMEACVEKGLNTAWKDTPFELEARIVVPATPQWYMDPATGWSRITRLQLACDQGEMEGCFQLGIFLKADVSAPKPDAVRAVQYFRKACEAGHALACEQLTAE
jgi:hypothetical protein